MRWPSESPESPSGVHLTTLLGNSDWWRAAVMLDLLQVRHSSRSLELRATVGFSHLACPDPLPQVLEPSPRPDPVSNLLFFWPHASVCALMWDGWTRARVRKHVKHQKGLIQGCLTYHSQPRTHPPEGPIAPKTNMKEY